MTDSAYRIAPPGFTDDEWETFNRETGLDRDRDAYRDDVALHRRKRRTWAERKRSA